MGHLVLGELCDENNVRDAVHVAVASVVANEEIQPGQRIGFKFPGSQYVSIEARKKIGIADPFLTQPIRHGQTFLMVLDPETVTGLRHSWTHPDFAEEAEREEDYDDGCRGC